LKVWADGFRAVNARGIMLRIAVWEV